MAKARVPKFEVWQSPTSGDWWWRLRAANGKIIATSGEGFKRRGHAVSMTQKIQHQSTIAAHNVLFVNYDGSPA